MKLILVLSGLITSSIASAIPSPVDPKSSVMKAPTPYDLTLVLEGTGDDAVWRLTDENVPPHVWERVKNSTDVDAPANPGLAKRWSYQCSTSHLAPASDCAILIDSIQYSTAPIPESPRDIVYANCYISWSAVVSGPQLALWPGGLDLYYFCSYYSGGTRFVSGVTRDYLALNVAQCLSNRHNGCSY
ncbi:hypothetical protein VTK73DRAFT_10175 [Phialemonium thermophilum]|uniref:WD-like domain-containing protein n=1 Tax=Phialemonium thermophilum TaxID=223376 RepID=A0ABR3VY44_9PEZI